jgi:hypothetical protein
MLRLVLVALGCAGVVAVPVYTATLGDKPPAVTGPLAEQTNNRWCASSPGTSGSACVFDYLLDPKTTTDPGDSWHAYWGSSETTASAKRGFCTTEVGLYLYWGPKGAARTYPPLGATAARPGAVARLTVDAAGHATVPASLQQKTSWPQGIVTATPKRGGGLVVDWQGRTTRGVSLISAAEVEHPPAAGAYIITQPVEIGAPCAGLPPPGPGFLARVVPASAPGRTAWLQVRIPGTGVRWSGGGFASGGGLATITFGSGSPYTIGVTGRSAVPITRGRNGFLPGRLVVRVRLHGPTGTRNYRLSVHVH